MPWAINRHLLTKQKFSVSDAILASQQCVLKNHNICCGVLPEKLFKSEDTKNDSYLAAIREDRLKKLIAVEVNAG
jgi:hypothetical protein